MRRIILLVIVILLGGFLVIQLVPYGRNHSNPPVIAEPDWDSQQTKALAQRACYDCHSNETVWPWYSHVAPMSWLLQNHVDEGREYLNFSEWGTGGEGEEGEEMAEVIYEGEMPVRSYLITHPEARLTEAERQQLAQGLLATGGGEESARGEREEREDDGEEHEEEAYEDDD